MYASHYYYLLWISLILAALSSCTTQPTTDRNAAAIPAETTDSLASVPASATETTRHQLWRTAYNEAPDSLPRYYRPQALLVRKDGTSYLGREPIAAQLADWRRAHPQLQAISDVRMVTTGRDDEYGYEIARYRMRADTSYTLLTIWNLAGDRPQKELEIISPTGRETAIPPAIDVRRAEWIERCNQHNAKGLVEQLYAPEAIYFNYRPAIIGHAAITREYAYMNDPEYELSLHPLHVVRAAEGLVYEIGQCRGSYGDYYILVWQRNAAGNWEIMLDANL